MDNNSPNPKSTAAYLLELVRKDLNLQIAFFLSIWFFCVLIASLFIQGIELEIGYSFKELLKILKSGEDLWALNAFKLAQMSSHLLQYLIPSLLFVGLLYPKKGKDYLFLDKRPFVKNILLAAVLLIVVFPFISWVYYWNTHLLPESAISKDTLELQRLLLKMNSPVDLMLNLLLFGLIAGLGEEILFRGLIQRAITKRSKNVHLGAILTGFLFSAMHFQLEGFVPRLLLGVLFGYLLILTSNLWLVIIIHILFNSVQVVIPYFNPQSAQNISEVQSVSPFLGLGSFLIFIIIMTIFVNYNKSNKQLYLNRINNS